MYFDTIRQEISCRTISHEKSHIFTMMKVIQSSESSLFQFSLGFEIYNWPPGYILTFSKKFRSFTLFVYFQIIFIPRETGISRHMGETLYDSRQFSEFYRNFRVGLDAF